MNSMNEYKFEPDCNDIMCGSYNQRILNSPPVSFDDADKYEIHMLLCERDVAAALWCLKTFYYHSKYDGRLVIHDDGSLNDKSVETLKRHLSGCKIISKKEADEKMAGALKGYRFSNEYRFGRNRHIFALKLLDFLFLSSTPGYLMMDADILFFNHCSQIINCIETGRGFFMRDSINAYALPIKYLSSKFPFEITDRVNAGLVFIPDKNIYEMDFIENYLELIFIEKNKIAQWWIEQTLHALIISKYSNIFECLETGYQISAFDDDHVTCPVNQNTVAHHYAASKMNSISYYRSIRNIFKNDFMEKLR